MKKNTKQGKAFVLCGGSENEFLALWNRLPAGVVKKCTAKDLAFLVGLMRPYDWKTAVERFTDAVSAYRKNGKEKTKRALAGVYALVVR